MTANILFSAREALWPSYAPALRAAFAARNLDVSLVQATDRPASIDYMIYAPARDDDDLSPYTGVKLIQSLWAGPDKLLQNPTLTQPLARMVDPGMTAGMVDFVLGHILYHHLHTQDFVTMPADDWRWDWGPPLSADRTVGVLGVGELGMACAQAAQAYGFRVLGWSRTAKPDAPVETHHGDAGLATVLAQAEILVTLLPRTPATENLLNADTLAQLPKGAAIINPGRGELIDDAALLAALDGGQIRAATLDAFRIEPLPDDHPYRSHPRVLVTPHVASETRVATACEVVADNIARMERGDPPLYLVDRALSY